MTAVLVTGAAGFVGSNVVRRFAQAGLNVVGFDRAAPDATLLRYLGSLAGAVTFVQGDLRDADWHEALPPAPVEFVVHAAAVTNTGADEESERAASAVAVNILGSVNVATWAAHAGVRRYIHCGSGSVYGRAVDTEEPLREDLPLEPQTIYALTKLAAERIVVRLADLLALSLVVARLPSQYGPMERNTGDRTRLSVLQSWCTAAVRGEELVVKLPQFPRDYTYVCDVADAIYQLAVAPSLSYRLYNVSSGIGLPHEEIIGTLRALVPEMRVRYVDDATPNASDRRPFSVERLRTDLGWTPEHTLRAALRSYVEWLRSQIAV